LHSRSDQFASVHRRGSRHPAANQNALAQRHRHGYKIRVVRNKPIKSVGPASRGIRFIVNPPIA
jgi:hypothetical protein